MKNRNKAEKFILEYILKIAGEENHKLYKDRFKSMNNKEFDNFMLDLEKGKIKLSIIAPNNSNVKLDAEKNMKIAKSLGYDFFQHIKINNMGTEYITPNKYMVLNIPVRRAAQLLTKKISIPTDDKAIDLTTGQVTGRSKASKITMPELQLLTSMGLKDSVVELMKIRGGDLGAKNAMTKLLLKQGSVSQKVLNNYATGVVSTKTMKAYFRSMMINPTGI